MSSRRQRSAGADPFAQGVGGGVAAVDSALFGGLRQADEMRVIVRPVDVHEVVVDQRIQVRVGGLDEERVTHLLQVLINGGAFKDPVWIARDGMWLADGFHRVEAYRRALEHSDVVNDLVELAPLRAELHPGGFDAALEYAEDANLQHGEPLTREDLKHLLWRRLERGHAWATASNRAIARDLGVSHPTVKMWKDEFEKSTGKNFPVREEHGEKKMTAAGRTVDTTPIARANQQRAKAPTATQRKRRAARALWDAVEALEAVEPESAGQLREWVESVVEQWSL